MNGIKLFVLLLQALQVFCSVENLRSLTDCGWTPLRPTPQIIGGYTIKAEEFSWVASLEYKSLGFGYCGGSLISSQYVLTAAHCVQGEEVDKYGGLTGVRLGNFTQEPYCDYGTPTCTSYLHFGIADKIVHENFHRDINHTLHNDIALLRLDSPVEFGRHMKPVCLPFNTKEPTVNTSLIVAGWGLTASNNDLTAKRAVGVPLLNESVCEYQDESLYCAAKLSETINGARTTCIGDSGGPLMFELSPRKMMIEGIVSFSQGVCVNKFFPTHYTRVRHYLSWIEKKVCAGRDCASVAEWKFPTDCGYTPMYPKVPSDGVNSVRPEEYSWMAKLVFGNGAYCIGSVINARYVLATAYCVSPEWISNTGRLVSVRLGNVVNGYSCDYGSWNCVYFQQFGVEKIIIHSEYYTNRHVSNIALIRLDRPIKFGPYLKPVCLPFGSNSIPEPPVGSSLTVSGWVYWKDGLMAKRDTTTTQLPLETCNKVWSVDVKQMCASDRCFGEVGSPLMYYHSANQRMVLEGIRFYGLPNCPDIRYPGLYTRVRSYGDWLDQNMEL